MKPLFGIGAQQVRAAGADRRFDLGRFGRQLWRCRRRRGMAHVNPFHQRRDRRADRGPVRCCIVAGAGERRAQSAEPRLVLQRRQPCPAQERPQRRVAERGSIKFSQMRVAAAVFLQQGIADVIKRGTVLFGGQRPAHGPGNFVKTHGNSQSPDPLTCPGKPGRSPPTCASRQAFGKLQKSMDYANVTDITYSASFRDNAHLSG